ncbi:MAG: CRISPR-associated endonuclease Cas2 [Patescibacteria group bacterium]
MARKRKYEQKLLRRLDPHESFLLERLRRDQEAVERSRRRHELLDMTKHAGVAVGKALLVIAALGTVAIVAAAAPNIFSAFGRMGGQRRFFAQGEVRKQLSYLRYRRYVRVKKDAGDGVAEVRLTALGKRHVIARAFGELKIMPQDTWDGKWRMVVFDIPDRHKWAREGLREKLKSMGFYRLQESVFVFPYPCEEEMRFLVDIYNIAPCVRLIETDSISVESDLLKEFALRRT